MGTRKSTFATTFAVAVALGCLAAAGAGFASGERSTTGCAERYSQAPIGQAARTDPILVPRGPVLVAVLCRYEGEQLPPHAQVIPQGALAGERRLRPNDTAWSRLVRSFNRLPILASQGALNCPIELGGRLYAILSYRSGREVLIRVQLSGCRVVSSPQAKHGYVLPVGVKRWLERLTR